MKLSRSLFRLVGILLATGASLASGQQPASDASDRYEKRDTWHETLLASLAGHSSEAEDVAPMPDLGRSDFTFSAWIRTEEGGTILARAPAEGNWAPQGKTFFVRGGRLVYDIGWVGTVPSRRAVADGRWHHVALAQSDDAFELWIDGEADVDDDLRHEPDVPGHVMKIGFTNGNYPGPSGFEGELDEVRIYDRRLAPDELRALFENPDSTAAEGMVARWTFDGDALDAGRPAILTNARFVEGRIGRALHLDGDGSVVVAPDAMFALWARLERDFPGEDAGREMDQEREDGIWKEPWRHGEWAELAARYAERSFRAPFLAERARAVRVVDEAGLREVRELYFRSLRFATLMEDAGDARFDAMHASIARLAERDPRLDACVERLRILEERAEAWETTEIDETDLEAWIAACDALRREALFDANPLLDFDSLLFVRRPTYQSSHYYTDFIDGCVHYGGNLCVLSLEDGTVTDLVPELEGGIFGRYDLSFDARRIVFDYKASPREGFRIWQVDVDGSNLRQLTFPPADEAERIAKYDNSHLGGTGRIYFHQTDDMHPCWLPDGDVCFVSTRCERGILCDPPDILTTTALYRMDADGSGMRLLSQTPVSEEVPTITNDGRILYTRWEYVDKGGSAVKCLWTMRPDGTGSAEIIGNDHAFPSFYNGRAIPGTDNLYVCIGGPHMPLGVGTVLRIDVNEPIRTRRAMTYLTPDIDIRSEWGYRHKIDGRWEPTQSGPLYDDPYPLSAELILVSHNPDRDVHDVSAYDLYLIDELGNRVLVHDDPEMSCWQPMPLRPRPLPHVLSSAVEPTDSEEQLATVLITDVHAGLDDASLAEYGELDIERSVAPGTVKYIRVMETVARPWTARRFWEGDQHGQQHSVVSLWTHTHVKVLHGIVPVEEDGSACFTVPADRNVFFQALDEDFMEVQRMRTFVNFRPGEVRSCIGCHEPRDRAPHNAPLAALRRPPRTPGPQPGETAPRPIHYPTDVQPILDRHCVSCHGGEEPDADLDLGGELTALFSRSYESILERDLVEAVSEIGAKMGDVDDTPPYTWGSHASGLIELIREGHEGVELSLEELVTLVTWVDANAPYYGTYYGRKNLQYRDHPDFRPIPTVETASGVPPDPGD